MIEQLFARVALAAGPRRRARSGAGRGPAGAAEAGCRRRRVPSAPTGRHGRRSPPRQGGPVTALDPTGVHMAPNDKASFRAGDREKALETALAQIERQFGRGAVMRLGDDARTPIEVIPTGSIALDVALGIGGLPRGRIVEIFGPESSGKTSLALHAVANAQRAGGIAAFIDAEHALDPEYARKLGVDTD